MTDRSPSLSEVLRLVLQHALSQVRVCLPGIVQSYDAATQTCSVQPAIKLPVVQGEDAVTLPVIPNVPVAHPRAGTWFVHMPLAVGDSVVLVFADRSIDLWRSLGGVQESDDLRQHHIADAIAIPANLYADAAALSAVAATHLSLGKQGGSTVHVKADGTVSLGSETPLDAVARATVVDAQRVALDTMLTALATDLTAIGVAVGAGATSAAAIATLKALSAWNQSVASSKVKADP